jgi:hypothetical protein
MKKIFIVLVTLLPFLAAAQDKTLLADVKKLTSITIGTERLSEMKQLLLPFVEEKDSAAFIKEFDDALTAYSKAFEEFYVGKYSHQEIEELIKLYESPLGKKLLANSPQLAGITYEAYTIWSDKFEKIKAYTLVRMQKEGE